MSGLRIGIDLGGSKVEGVLMDATGTVVYEERKATPPDDYTVTVQMLCAFVEELDARARARCPVGLGTPGAWVLGRHAMKNCNSTWLNDRPLLDDLIERLGPRVKIANDANCFALSEARAGAGRDAKVVFGVILGTGVGGGIVVGGDLVLGANAVGGEWGHTPMPYLDADPMLDPALSRLESLLESRACYCGRADCIETYLSGPGLARTHEELFGQACTASEAAAAGMPSMDLYLAMLARSLAQIVNVLDPDVIVLGGGVSNVKRIHVTVPRLMPSYGFAHEGATLLKPAVFGDSSGVRGAAWLNEPEC